VDAVGGGEPLSGVAVAEVVNNIDPTDQGRIQLRLPWMPGVEPWGRVSSGSGGPGNGIYFIPQVGDEVLVAFHHGDVREVYVLGSLWSSKQKPPTKSTQDPVDRRVIRTPKGHEIELDDKEKTVTVKTIDGHKIRMEPDKIEISTDGGTASVVLEKSGKVTVKANTSIELKAQTITLDATTLELKGSGAAKLTAGGTCEIKGAMVKLN
jgi:uncharacterized protein involved in type VI secretion and phage assembly